MVKPPSNFNLALYLEICFILWDNSTPQQSKTRWAVPSFRHPIPCFPECCHPDSASQGSSSARHPPLCVQSTNVRLQQEPSAAFQLCISAREDLFPLLFPGRTTPLTTIPRPRSFSQHFLAEPGFRSHFCPLLANEGLHSLPVPGACLGALGGSAAPGRANAIPVPALPLLHP